MNYSKELIEEDGVKCSIDSSHNLYSSLPDFLLSNASPYKVNFDFKMHSSLLGLSAYLQPILNDRNWAEMEISLRSKDQLCTVVQLLKSVDLALKTLRINLNVRRITEYVKELHQLQKDKKLKIYFTGRLWGNWFESEMKVNVIDE